MYSERHGDRATTAWTAPAHEKALFLGSLLLGLAWTGHLAASSTGSLLDDEIGHYLLSRYTLHYPANLLNTWGRAAQTLLYVLPAQRGLLAARLFSVLLAGLAALITTRFAERLGAGKWSLLVPLFVFFQPWYSNSMFGVLTEVPFTLFLVAAAYCWSIERYGWASVLAGVLPLLRHEGIALTGLWLLFVLHRRYWRAAFFTVLPLLMYNSVSWAVEGEPALAVYFRPRPTTFYGRGDWLHFVRPLRHAVGAPVLALATVGLWPARRIGPRLCFLAPFPLYLGMHAAIYRFGLFSSGGYVEFLPPLAPAFAILAAFGAGWIATSAQRLASSRVNPAASRGVPAAIGAAVAVGTIAYGITRTAPRLLTQEDEAMRQAAEWLTANGLQHRPIVSTHVWFWYFHQEPVSPHHNWGLTPNLDTLPVGAIAVWDRHYSERWGLRREDLGKRESDWALRQAFGRDTTAMIFERYRRTPPPPNRAGAQ